MTTIHETIEVQARKLPGLLSTVFRWLGNALARLERDKARAWLRLAVAAWMIRGGRAARSGMDRRARVLHR
ncbi:MAG: hypothetical protein ACLP8X_11140 [Streptosporangiaceae bacterium]